MSRVCRGCNAVLDDTTKICYRCGLPVPDLADKETGYLTENEETGRLIEEGETELLYEDDRETDLLSEKTGELHPEDMPRFTPPQPPVMPNVPSSPRRLNEKEFYEGFATKQARGWTTAIGVISLVSGAVSVPSLFLGNFLSIIDIAFYISMGVLILTTKKWVLPLVVTIYSSVFSLISLALGGAPGGIAALVVGIFATIHLKKVNDAYRLYYSSGVLPQKPTV